MAAGAQIPRRHSRAWVREQEAAERKKRDREEFRAEIRGIMRTVQKSASRDLERASATRPNPRRNGEPRPPRRFR
jgi:hypothetical protein